jgi:hypothetical protein
MEADSDPSPDTIPSADEASLQDTAPLSVPYGFMGLLGLVLLGGTLLIERSSPTFTTERLGASHVAKAGAQGNAAAAVQTRYAPLAVSGGVSPEKGKCTRDEMGYHLLSCPRTGRGEKAIDPRVSYLEKHQNPPDCTERNFFLAPMSQHVGFGATVQVLSIANDDAQQRTWCCRQRLCIIKRLLPQGSVVGNLYAAVQTRRVYMQYPEDFVFGGCESGGWDCYFAPVTNCSYERDVEGGVLARGGSIYHTDNGQDLKMRDPEVNVFHTTGEPHAMPLFSSKDPIAYLYTPPLL